MMFLHYMMLFSIVSLYPVSAFSYTKPARDFSSFVYRLDNNLAEDGIIRKASLPTPFKYQQDKEKQEEILNQLFEELKTVDHQINTNVITDEIKAIWKAQMSATEQVLLERGLRFFEQGKYKFADRIFSHIIHLNARNSEAWYWHAKIALKQSQYRTAIYDLNKVISLNEKHYPAYFLLASIMEMLDEKKVAYELYQILLEIYPTHKKAIERHKRLKEDLLGRFH